MSMQRYVSDELTHFVGRNQTQQEQYDLLVKILTTGWLRAGGDEALGEEHYRLAFQWGRKLSDSELFQPSMVCFCDIPLADLGMHVQKYSRFGLAFSKKFLIAKGAAPVFYIPRGGPLFQKSRGDLLDRVGEEVSSSMTARTIEETQQKAKERDTALQRFLDHIVFSYLKPFDESKAEDHLENFYMEREWRTLTSVRFTLSDVRRVIIPESYGSRFRQNVPSYCGQVTFVQ